MVGKVSPFIVKQVEVESDLPLFKESKNQLIQTLLAVTLLTVIIFNGFKYFFM